MKRRKRLSVLTALIAFAVMVALPAKVFAAEDTVSRGEWLSKLATQFDMTIEEGEWPDNYFPDLSPSSEYYDGVMKCIEFGVVDSPSGEEIRPDDPTTREFAAQTLVACLGYSNDTDTYSFTDSTDTSDPGDLQIAVDRGWFTLVDGKVLPNQSITTAERDVMLNDAQSVLSATEESSSVTTDIQIRGGGQGGSRWDSSLGQQ